MYNWRLITTGHLSRNKFWGESEDEIYREPLATCTLIQNEKHNIIVDPSKIAEEMKNDLFNRSGLKPEQITIVYTTHMHADHFVSPELFPNAIWYMASKDLANLKGNWEAFSSTVKGSIRKDIIDRYKPAPDELLPGIHTIPLPGHTEGICGLSFKAPEGRVLISGDAIMTHEFFNNLCTFNFYWDIDMANKSILKAAELADIIVPGHGHSFLVKSYFPSDIKI